jgi:mRNA interferase RelE/StbE
VIYRVELTATAEDDLSNLDPPVAQRALNRLKWFSEHFETVDHEALSGRWQGMFRFRVGVYRVLYTYDRTEGTIAVHFIRHRREVYNL